MCVVYLTNGSIGMEVGERPRLPLMGYVLVCFLAAIGNFDEYFEWDV